MDAITRQHRTEQLAHQIWEAEGRPDGQSARHWAMAERLTAAEVHAEAQDDDRVRALHDDPQHGRL